MDQLVLTGEAGFKMLNGFMVTLGRGVDPSPPSTRPSAAEAENAAKEAAAFAVTEAEVARVARQAAASKAASEAKITQDAENAAAHISANAAADAALYTNPAAGGSGAGNMFQPLVPAILKAVGRQTPATEPVVIQPLPEIAQNGAIGIPG